MRLLIPSWELVKFCNDIMTENLVMELLCGGPEVVI